MIGFLTWRWPCEDIVRQIGIMPQTQRLELKCHNPRNTQHYHKLEEANKNPPLGTLEKAQPDQNLDFELLVFRMWDNKCLLFEATQFEALCYSSHRKLIDLAYCIFTLFFISVFVCCLSMIWALKYELRDD